MEVYNNINEINRYNFKYDIDKSIQNYEFPNNKDILIKQQKFYDLRYNYRNNILYKYFYHGTNSKKINYTYIINKFGDQKKNNMMTLSYSNEKKPDINTYIFNQTNNQFKNKKFNLIVGINFNYDDIKDLNIEDRIKYQYNPTIKKIELVFSYLNEGGYFFFNLFGYDSKIIKLIHLLLLIFTRIIFHRNYVMCFGYNSIIDKEKLINLFENINFVKIDPLLDLIKLSKQKIDDLSVDIEIINAIIENNLEKYFEITNKAHFNETIEFQILNKNKNIDYEFEKELYENLKLTSVSLQSGVTNSSIKPVEGNFLYNTILKYNCLKCMEVGMAYGISSMYILLALKKNLNSNKRLDSIDPFQSTQWKNFGVNLVKSIKMDKYHILYENTSYRILPELLEKKESYDLIFIDGWHTFDYTLLDFFYANLLLKKDGIIIVDDAYHQGVNKCLKYIDTNYKHYKRIQSPSTVGAYQKITEDVRTWDYHNNF